MWHNIWYIVCMNQAKLPSYILLRDGVFYIRISVPKELRILIGKSELKRSLNTSDRARAALLAPPAIQAFQSEIARARTQCTPVHNVVSDIPIEDVKAFVRGRLEAMQASADQSRSRGLQLSSGQGGAQRRERLLENQELLKFFEEIEADATWDRWRKAMGRSAVQAFEEHHQVVIEASSPAYHALSEFGAQVQIEHVRRAIYRDSHPHGVEAAPDSGQVFGERNSGRTLDQVLKAYRADKERTWKPASGDAFRKADTLLRDFFGSTKRIDSISRSDFRELFSLLPRVPSSYRKMRVFRGLTLRQVVDAADVAEVNPARLSDKSCKDYAVHINSMLNWAAQEEIIIKNPARGVPLPRTARVTERRRKFSSGELQQLFTSGQYEPDRELTRSGGAYWLPLIALFTGMRSGEIGQLTPQDFADVDGVACIRLTDSEALKTEQSARDIPLHPELHRLGLLAYVAERLHTGERDLFADVPVNAKGDRSSQFSKVFRKQLKASGLADPGLCMHSFRHTMTAALVANSTPAPVAEALLGWGKKGRTMFQHYGGRPPMAHLEAAIAGATYPDLNLRHLYQCATEQRQPTQRRQFD